MLIYLCVFALSCACFAYSEPAKKGGKAIAAAGILLPCLLAGLRDVSIGTDVQVYLKPMCDQALRMDSFAEYCQYFKRIEIVFCFIVYYTMKGLGHIGAVQFLIHFMIVGLVYAGAKANEDRSPVWFSMLVFYLMFYNMSLNIMRHWMAMAIVLYAMKYLEEKRWVRYFLSIIPAILIHLSASVAILFVPIYMMYDTKKKVILEWGRYGFGLGPAKLLFPSIVIIVIFGLLGKWTTYALQIMNLSDYSYYFSGMDKGISLNQLILRLPILVMYIFSKKEISDTPMNRFLFSMFVADMVIAQFFWGVGQAIRVEMWFSLFYVMLFPRICYSIQSITKRRAVVCGMCGYMLFYWTFYYVLGGSAETIPYRLCF